MTNLLLHDKCIITSQTYYYTTNILSQLSHDPLSACCNSAGAHDSAARKLACIVFRPSSA